MADFDALQAEDRPSVPTELAGVASPIWGCKIGVMGQASLPSGADAPMRRAVEGAFRAVTGIDAEFTFSGWSESLSEGELAVIENRVPSDEHYAAERARAFAPELLAALTDMLPLFVEAQEALTMQGDVCMARDGSDAMHPVRLAAQAAIANATGAAQ